MSGDRNLAAWLWDYDARAMSEGERTDSSPHARVSRRGFSGTLFKTDAFLEAHPFGTVPAAFSPRVWRSSGDIRVELRAFSAPLPGSARPSAGCMGGDDDYEASRIDSFLDANLVFAREAQLYLLAMDKPVAAVHERMAAAYEFYLAGVENALRRTDYLAGETLSIADISFVCDFAQFLREGHYEEALATVGLALISHDGAREYPRRVQPHAAARRNGRVRQAHGYLSGLVPQKNGIAGGGASVLEQVPSAQLSKVLGRRLRLGRSGPLASPGSAGRADPETGV